MAHIVRALQLNLRSEPDPGRPNVIAVLSQGTVVEKIADAPRPSWWEVHAFKGGERLHGFLNSSFLAPAGSVAFPEARAEAGALPDAEMPASPNAKRSRAGGWASPIGEAGHPGLPSTHGAGPAAGVHALIGWLDVENPGHLRWKPTSTSTYCNVYAYDLSRGCGAYLPRVWWTDPAITRLRNGETVPVQYGVTVTELAANYIFNWFEAHGESFGWTRIFDVDDLQSRANSGEIGIICAQRTLMNRPGHIQAVIPEFGGHRAIRSNGKVRLPLQSNAGSRNFNIGFMGNSHWWQGSAFRDFGFWTHRVG